MLVEAYLEKAMKASVSSEAALLIIDADHFKRINDEHGHQIGDHALKVIAATIREALDGVELVGRVGGEEFAVFLPNSTSEQAFKTAENIRRKVRNIAFPEGTAERALSVSIGGVSFSNPTTYKELFKLADLRLYEAKAAGRDLVRI